MGRGMNSKGLRKTKRQMARGKIHGTTLTEKGKRVTPRDVKDRRELNKTIALTGNTLSLEEFQTKQASWVSETDAQRKAVLTQATERMYKLMNELED